MTSDFSKGAKDEAERADATPVRLMNGEQLVALLVENEIGVRRTPLQLIGLGEKLNTGKERDN
jgi:restriction system protein